MLPLGQTKPIARGFQRRALLRRRWIDKQAGEAFDHDAAHLGDGVADERNAVRAPVGEVSVSVACARTHSAPARVLPEPRPPSSEPGVPGLAPAAVAIGGCWSWRPRAASHGRSWSHSSGVTLAAIQVGASGWRDKLSKTLRNLAVEGVRLGCAGLGRLRDRWPLRRRIGGGQGPAPWLARWSSSCWRVGACLPRRRRREWRHWTGVLLGFLQLLLHAKLHQLEVVVSTAR